MTDTRQRSRNHGIRKVCDCPRSKWVKCPHPWHFNFKPKGGPGVRLSLDVVARARGGRPPRSKTEAETLGDALRTEIRNGTFSMAPSAAMAPTLPTLTLEDFGRAYFARRGKPATANESAHMTRLSAFVLSGSQATLGAKPLASVTTDDLELFFAHLRDSGRAAATVNKYRLFLARMLRWAVKKGYVTRNPLTESDTIKHQSERSARRSRRLVPDILDDGGNVTVEGEERRLLAVASPPLQRLIVGALETGARRGELLALRWADVDRTRSELKIRAETAKTRTMRILPISARLDAVLEMARSALVAALPKMDERALVDHMAQCYVFGDQVGQKLTTAKRSWETAVLKAHGHRAEWLKGGKLSAPSRAQLRAINLHFHDLRHEAGSRFLEVGRWPVHHVQQMLGHADLKQTSTYLNATLVGLKDSMRRYDEASLRCKPVANEAASEHPLSCNTDSPGDEKSLVN